jgi:hypothetical protein
VVHGSNYPARHTTLTWAQAHICGEADFTVGMLAQALLARLALVLVMHTL